jgi:hypothetical protein
MFLDRINKINRIKNWGFAPLLGHPLRGQPSAGGYPDPKNLVNPVNPV